jgi:hypothetical protein
MMKRMLIGMGLAALLFAGTTAYGQGDIFQVKTPNVMIILDTSSSMKMKPDGTAQAAGNALGEDGKTIYAFEGNGNHPGSKLYQAKQAMKTVIQEVVKDQVNLGFATYAQGKTEYRRGYYQRDRRNYTTPTPDQWKWTKLYWRYNTYRHGPWTATSFSPNSFTDAWSVVRNGVTVGFTFQINHTFDNSPGNNARAVPPPHPPGTYAGPLTMTVTSIVYNAEYNWYTYTYQDPLHDHYEETTRTLTFANSNPIDCNAQFSKIWGTYKTYASTDAEQISNPAKWNCQGPTLVPGVAGGFGAWFKEYQWQQFGGTSCPATNGADNLPANGTQTTKWSITNPATCYNYSDYYYPADGSVNKPHAWSYYKISGATWKVANQTPAYYPSKDGSGNFNNAPGVFDNHTFFVNFPDDKDPLFTDTVRSNNTTQILGYLDLTPVKSPETSRYWTTLPVHAIQGKHGLTSNTVDSKFTPLADSLAWANIYFGDYINNYGGGDPSSKQKFGVEGEQIPCRGNYVILLTDGLESARCVSKNGDNTCIVSDYTQAPLEAQNLAADPLGVKTYVIGFGTDLKGNETLNNIAVKGKTSKAYFAANLGELKSALSTIFGAITNQFYGRSNPVVSRARDRLYRGNFEFYNGDFMGHLMAWDADKETGQLAPTMAWDGGKKVSLEGRGTVYTWTDSGLNPTRKLFNDSEATLYPFVNPSGEDVNGDSAVDNNDAKAIINFTLHPEYDGGKYKGKRPINVPRAKIGESGDPIAAWNLGDIYHSSPVAVAEPAFYFTDNGYKDFYNNNSGREPMVYVGANDGMLHGFRNSDGTETFAFIPKSLLGKLNKLSKPITISQEEHFFVDSSPRAYDVYFGSEGKWKTVLVSGLRQGGPYFFCLDVTSPGDPKILWEWTHSSLGNTWGRPEIGRVKVGGVTKFVAFLPGGYSTVDGKGNSLHIVDIETGAAIKSFTVGAADNKVPSGATAYGNNADGLVESVYFGDIKGTLWKLDVKSTATAEWTLNDFYTPPTANKRPIFYPPAVTSNDLGKVLVFFGTGNELDLFALTTNFFYEIEDQGNNTGKLNWSKTLESGEKVLAAPSVANYVVYFTSWVYKTSSDFCGAGEGRLWGLTMSKSTGLGGEAGLVTLDSSTGKWVKPDSGRLSIGPSIPSAPVVTNGMIYVSTSLNANKVIQIPIPPWSKGKIKSWREVYR